MSDNDGAYNNDSQNSVEDGLIKENDSFTKQVFYGRWAILFTIAICLSVLLRGSYGNMSSKNLRFEHVDHDMIRISDSQIMAHTQAVHYWIFPLDTNNEKTLYYAKQAVLSALHYTNLIPVGLLEAHNKPLEDWMGNHNVTLLDPTKSSIFRILQKHPKSRDAVSMANWYRVGIPEILSVLDTSKFSHLSKAISEGKSLDYVLYTDPDVLFVNEVKITNEMLPRYVSLGIQGDFLTGRSHNKYGDRIHTSTGVMVLNVSAMMESSNAFLSHIDSKLDILLQDNAPFNSQAAFHQFYPIKLELSTLDYINMFINYRSYYDAQHSQYWADLLPKIFEWEPYLGVNEKAAIIYWHGQKISIHSCQELTKNRFLNDSSNCLLHTLVDKRVTEHPKTSVFSYPPAVEWFQANRTPSTIDSLWKDYKGLVYGINSKSKNKCHITVPITDNVVSGYQYYSALFFDYMALLCSSSLSA